MPENKNIKILDIGCGAGHFLYFLKETGYTNYFGIDISEEQIEFCRENVSKDVAVADGFEFLKGNKNFNLIVLNDVLEHIAKERLFEFLELVRRALESGGKLMIKVPNMANPFSMQIRYCDITHDIGFTQSSLEQALMMAGFKDISVRGASYPVISFQSFVGKIIEKIIQVFVRFLLRVQGYNSSNALGEHLISSASVN